MAGIRFAVAFAGLFLLAWGFAGPPLRLHPFAMALFPAPVALCWATGAPLRALSLVACAGAAAWAATQSLSVSAAYVIAADSGVLLGVLLVRRMRYGRALALVTALGFALSAGYIAGNWRELRRNATIHANAFVASLEQSANGATPAGEAVANAVKFYDVHWEELNLGMAFGAVFLSSALVLSVLNRWLRRRGAGGLEGSFREARPPDWLVWIGIALAACWFYEQRWPHDLLRMMVWNAALGLSFVYWMNGFGIVLYALGAFQTNLFLASALVLALFYLNAHPVLGALGLFDTWWDVRRRIDAALAARRAQPPAGEN